MQIYIYTSVSRESNMALWTSDCILSRSKGTHKGPNSGQADKHPRNPEIRSSRVIRNSSLGGWKIWYYSLKSCISGACWFHMQEKYQNIRSSLHNDLFYTNIWLCILFVIYSCRRCLQLLFKISEQSLG